jgi:alpha-tubulin suppressor-like RCC1 family protein
MSLETTTNFIRSDGLDLGRILITKDYLISVYPEIGQQIGIPPELWVWGVGTNGRLGNGATTGNISTPVTTSAGGTNWKQVSTGGRQTSAIKTDGTLWTWGYGNQGRLGNASTTNVSTPVTTFAGGTNWKQVSSGGYTAAAIKTDGTLWVWGAGTYGLLGNANTTNRSTPVTTFSGGTNWKQVSAGADHCAAIKTDGTLWTWGTGSNGRLGNAVTTGNISTPVTTFAGGTNWKQVSATDLHTAAIKTDGTLWIWGNGGYGRLGNANTTNRSTPVTTFAGGNNWKQVSCASNHTAAIKTDGTLWTWGSVNLGILGNGVTDVFGTISTPITTFAGGTNWKQVSCRGTSIGAQTAAIKTDGTLWVWGSGGSGRLGNAVTTGAISTPVTTFAGGTNWKQVSSGYDYTAAIRSVDFASF